MRPSLSLPKIGAWFGLLLLTGFAGRGFPCSTFVLRQGERIVFGRNYDWNIGYGLILVNQAGLRKTVFNTQPSSPVWNVKYGSVTFNQYGKESPMDGMNEAGLVVAQMRLDATVYPAADSRAAIGVLSWIQYQLDNCATVEEVLRTDSIIRIPSGSVPLHFMIADRSGDSATLEFLGGRLVVHRGETLPIRALTNHTYDESLANLRQYTGFGGSMPIPSSSGSLNRFVRIADRIARYGQADPTPLIDYAFDVLASAAQTSTQWSTVFDLTGGKAYFRTKQSSAIKSIQPDGLEFLCRTAAKLLDIDIAVAGDVTGFMQPYTAAANRDLIARTFRETDFLRNTPDNVIDALATFPDSFICCRPKPWADKARAHLPLQVRNKS